MFSSYSNNYGKAVSLRLLSNTLNFIGLSTGLKETPSEKPFAKNIPRHLFGRQVIEI
jgi:hypothetical protein